ncbi:MAG TPA: cation diffusion facilitator family transporter [Terriglobales bacterium]
MDSTKRVVYAAIAANVGIAISKYVAAAFTGSSAMLAEAFHSTVDSGNELLLLVGIKRSQKPADRLHPFGHGKEVYFWSLLVAILIFGIGGGFSTYEGIIRLANHEPASDPKWNYVVLAVAFVLEGYSWWVSLRELREKQEPDESLWRHIRRSKDPTVFTVFVEDTGALIGIAFAFLGILLTQITGNPAYDPVASIAIGILLATIALFLAAESRDLLIGETASPEQIEQVRGIITSEPGVDQVGELLTMQLGPDQVLLNVEIMFRRGLTVQELESTIDNLERRIRECEPSIRRIFIEAESLRGRALAGPTH